MVRCDAHLTKFQQNERPGFLIHGEFECSVIRFLRPLFLVLILLHIPLCIRIALTTILFQDVLILKDHDCLSEIYSNCERTTDNCSKV